MHTHRCTHVTVPKPTSITTWVGSGLLPAKMTRIAQILGCVLAALAYGDARTFATCTVQLSRQLESQEDILLSSLRSGTKETRGICIV
jgi:hypothetical protein